jgi:hypothetical protein
LETIHPSSNGNGSRKRKSLAYFYEELNKDKKFSTEATVSSAFPMPMPTSNANIPYSQQEAIAIGYAQYALMQSLTQQLRVNYPAAFLHAAAAAAATGYLPLPSKGYEKNRERRQPVPESDNNNNHIRVTPFSSQEQPYRRDTYQTLLESSQLLGQHKVARPVPIDRRKQPANSSRPSGVRYTTSSSSSSTSPTGSPPSVSPRKSTPTEPINEYVCIPKKLMPVIGARINDWLERNLNFVSSLSVINESVCNEREKLFLLSHVWHRLVLISMIENSFEIYVTKDLQIGNDVSSSVSQTHPTENDVKQIESLISRGKTLDIDEIGFNLIREVIIYKEGKTLLASSMAEAFDKAECHAQARLTSWCSSRVKYSKIVFFLCNTYQVKQDIFERLFCAGSMHQSTPIHTYLERFLNSTSTDNA